MTFTLIPQKGKACMTYAPGTRVELHPATNAWMKGDRYGEVLGEGKNQSIIRVKMDKSGKTLSVLHANILRIV